MDFVECQGDQEKMETLNTNGSLRHPLGVSGRGRSIWSG